jgi:DNA-binding CsgD family transcriptional regulator
LEAQNAIARVPERVSDLSRREYEVAQLIGEGLTNREIAARLFISIRTVEGHVVQVLNKLGFQRRSQIASWISRQPYNEAVAAKNA